MKLPSKRFLAAETGTSVITVQHAYDLLADEGYIQSRERSGYYVCYEEGGISPVRPEPDGFPVRPGSGSSQTRHGDGSQVRPGDGSPPHGLVDTDESEFNEISDIPVRGPIVTPEQEQFPFSVLARTARRVPVRSR